MNHLKYLLSLFLPISVALFLYIGPHNIANALAWTIPLWSLIVFDWLGPKNKSSHNNTSASSWFYDAILYGLSFLQLLIISLLVVRASELQWNSFDNVLTSLVNLFVMRVLVGTTSGSSAIIVAHELIHRPKSYQRIFGRLLLYTVCNDHFVIAHLRGHHHRVATPEDIATAKKGESFEHYWKRVTVGHFKYAWHSELDRLRLRETPIYHYKMIANQVLQGLIIEMILLIVILLFFGWAAVFIFIYQAYSGMRLLETINYYQHWGLEQGRARNSLAWVNSSQVTEYALLGLSNHIAHHKNASIPFYKIPRSHSGPSMPYGYFVSNLWVKLNNASYRQDSTKRLKNRANSL